MPNEINDSNTVATFFSKGVSRKKSRFLKALLVRDYVYHVLVAWVERSEAQHP
jgi:hypothetical protein